ncbi:MAG: histidine phosphatase family protein [Prevotella sp.]|nr:histidine phosphatase family protein [Prevotella sp.]
MRKLLLPFFLLVALFAMAQSPREELKRCPALSGGNFLAYPGPTQLKLTPAPKGKHAFYISHYGRHGSRYHTKAVDYDYVYEVLLRADEHGALSPLGKDVLGRATAIRQEAQGRHGDLTPMGAQQVRDIANRMYERFPEVFNAHAVVMARSTTTPRCILSMAHFAVELARHSPGLTIRQNATEYDHYFLRSFIRSEVYPQTRDYYQAFCNRHQCWQRVVTSLFADTAYMHRYVNGERLNYFLFREAAILQGSQSGRNTTLYDLFNDDEVYEMWLKENAYWFLAFGFSDINGGELPFSQTQLLRNIIEQADSCIGVRNSSCTLRFGHETILLPLVCLLDVNGYGQKINDVDQLERKNWVAYRVFPMASNLQFVFYRAHPADKDVVFKVLLNENEATLPLKTDIAPYYHWKDFRDYYLTKLDNYSQQHK